MADRSKIIFGNAVSAGDYKKALRSKAKYARKYGDDSAADYPVRLAENRVLFPLLKEFINRLVLLFRRFVALFGKSR